MTNDRIVRVGVCYALYVVLGALFMLKYGLRVAPAAVVWGAVAVWALAMGLLVVWLSESRLSDGVWRVAAVVAAAAMVCGVVMVQRHVDLMSVRVDRWSALQGWNDYFWSGRYPYDAPTHLEGGHGSPFPVWQLFHAPFCVAGHVGWSLCVAVVLWVWAVGKCAGPRAAAGSALLLFGAPGFWYEAAVSSDLMTNLLFVCAWLLFWHARGWHLSACPVGLGIVCGLLMSSRLVVGVPLLVVLLGQWLAAGWPSRLRFLLSGAAAFVLTLLPFVVWDAGTTLCSPVGPVGLQTRQGSWLMAALMLVACVVCGWRCRSMASRLLAVGLLAVGLTLASMFRRMAADAFSTPFFSPMYDLTYLSMALPFVLPALLMWAGNSADASAPDTDARG